MTPSLSELESLRKKATPGELRLGMRNGYNANMVYVVNEHVEPHDEDCILVVYGIPNCTRIDELDLPQISERWSTGTARGRYIVALVNAAPELFARIRELESMTRGEHQPNPEGK